MTPGRPFDPGLQAERTLLGWQRTTLAAGVAGAIMIRFAAEAIGLAAILLGALAIGSAALAEVGARRRYRRTHGELVGGTPLTTGATPLLLTSIAVMVIALGAAAFLASAIAAAVSA